MDEHKKAYTRKLRVALLIIANRWEQAGVVAHICNLSIGEAEARGL
jgi:hypothetical protein